MFFQMVMITLSLLCMVILPVLFIFLDFIKWYNEPTIENKCIRNGTNGIEGISGIQDKEGIDDLKGPNGIINAGTYAMNNHHVIQ